MRMISPNDLQQAAKDAMLEGREPASVHDWMLCANYWAANVQKGLETSILPVLGLLFDCPVSREDLVVIAEYQAGRKPHE
jgi:hypothetical protein